MKITEENKLKGSLFIEAYGSLIDGISKDAESETEKALDITFNAIGAASATVMFAIDPLGSIIGAGVGWLIEHVSFLRDALNQLMGNPEEIQANVEANKARAAELRVLAEDHKSGLATFDGWSGQSSERFKASMDGMGQELDDLANAVESKAKIVAIMGMLVTVLRDIVRDLIAQLIGSLIAGALIAAAMMIPTFGTSIAVFGGFAVGKAVALGVNIASRVARVVAALGRQMKRIGDLDDIMKKVSKGWERFENSADVAEITYEGYKAQKGVDDKIDEAMANRGGGGGGNTPPGASDGKTAADATGTASAATLANARVGMVQQDGTAQATLANARIGTVQQDGYAQATLPNAPLRATASAEPMQALRRTTAAEPMQALRRTEAAEPMQAAKRLASEPLQPMQAVRAMDAAEPLQARTAAVHATEPLQARAMHVTEPLQARTAAMHAAEPMQPLQPMQRAEAVQAPMAFSRVEAAEAPVAFSRASAQDSTMVSGVSMTAGAPMHEAVQPMQAREMYSSPETPSEPLQAQSGYEPLARTQMSHAYDALEPSEAREVYGRVDAQPVYESVNPLMASEPLQPTIGYEAAGGAAAQPLRPTIAHERSVRPTE
ncbi:hypothetical protein SK854_09275 [Lentzea sp. BCCO 10_0061]|uniref:Uncharacterized protein n=1 Tax=Lentzea sokolovensis TaxID=3095429 RepID=A0ABU4US31_9PSEU|nr:hypothetical protein [Lentzea sp. BCCO 10_0061]MDX8142302.1 hypothetical protein [Lentzea sp. BCCO 10_0061]